MKVQIEGDLFLESDSMQFIIKEYTGRVVKDEKTGKETEQYNTHGYFSNIKSAINFFLKMKIKESNAATLNELLAEVKRWNEWAESFERETA